MGYFWTNTKFTARVYNCTCIHIYHVPILILCYASVANQYLHNLLFTYYRSHERSRSRSPRRDNRDRTGTETEEEGSNYTDTLYTTTVVFY